MFLSFIVVLVLIGLISAITRQKQPSIWFPSFGSMLRALGLAIPTWFGLVIFFSLSAWQCFVTLIFAMATDAPLNVISGLAGFGLLFLVGSFFWYLLLVGLYSLVLRLFWSEVPQFLNWLKPPKKKRDVLFGWLASSLAALVGVTPLVIVILFSGHGNDFTIESRRYREALNQAFVEGALISWFVVCAYLYQIRSVCRYAVARKRKAKQLTT